MNPDSRAIRIARASLLRALRPLGRLSGLRVDGRERLPRSPEPLVIACNHAAFVDTFWLHLALPEPPSVCGAKPRLYRNAPLRALLALADIRRVEGEAGFLATAGSLLARGRTLLVYPEMGRNPDGPGPFQPWLARLVLTHMVPVLPVYLWGTTTGESGPPLLVVGERRTPSGSPEACTAALRADILALRDRARRLQCS